MATAETVGMTTTITPADTVPVIDIAHLERLDALAAIDTACRDWGFFQVTGHGIDARVITDLFAAAHAFFAQPAVVKRGILRTADNPWGYFDQELTKNTLDWKQVFDYGPADGTSSFRSGRKDYRDSKPRYATITTLARRWHTGCWPRSRSTSACRPNGPRHISASRIRASCGSTIIRSARPRRQPNPARRTA